MTRWIAEIRGPKLFGRAGLSTWIDLRPNQPLILTREPDNPADRNAIIVSDLYGQPCGYIARERAAILAIIMDAGNLVMAKVRSRFVILPPNFKAPTAIMWIDRTGETVTTRKARPRTKETIT